MVVTFAKQRDETLVPSTVALSNDCIRGHSGSFVSYASVFIQVCLTYRLEFDMEMVRADILGMVLPFLLEHSGEETSWSASSHFGNCGQSCGCCRAHNRVDAYSGCDACLTGWILTTVSYDINLNVKKWFETT